MPNWVTVKIKASPAVIRGMVNNEGRIDFALVLPFPGSFEWNYVSGNAESAAERASGKAVSRHPLIAALETDNRQRADITKLDDEAFDQFLQMLRNYRKCGYLHSMDFAREAWGTKWNACESEHDADAGTAHFDTAWSCPQPVLAALSRKFPEDRIEVTYADEDIGSNCGTFTLLNGEKVESDEAPPWSQQSAEDRVKWTAFACEIKGGGPSDYSDD